MDCLSALLIILKARNIAIIHLYAWSFTSFNDVLMQGDKMYLRALNNGLLVLNPDVEFFVYTVDNLAILFVDK